LRLPVPELQSKPMRILGPTGAYIKHAWTWICPLVIAIAIVSDLFVSETNRHQKKVGDSHFWHIVSIGSILPLPLFAIYYIYKRDKSAFQATAWRELQMPYDDSTICNTVLTQEVELDELKVERRKDCIVSLKYQTESAKVPVEFTISNGLYFDMDKANSGKGISPKDPYFQFKNPHVGTGSSDTTPMLQDDDDDDNNDDSDDDIHSFSDSSSSTSRLHSSSDSNLFSNLTSLTGQPNFINSAPVPSLGEHIPDPQPHQTNSEPPPEYTE